MLASPIIKKHFLTYAIVSLFAVGTMVSLVQADVVLTQAPVSKITSPIATPTGVGKMPTLPAAPALAFKNNSACPPRGDLEQWAASHIGGVVGRFSDSANQNSVLGGVAVTIPELKLSTTSCPDGSFYFPYDGRVPGVPNSIPSYVTIKGTLFGYGPYTMAFVPFSKTSTGIVIAYLNKGNEALNDIASVPLDQLDKARGQSTDYRKGFDAAGVSSLAASTPIYYSQSVPPPYIRIAIRQNGTNGLPSSSGSVLKTDYVDFDYYVKHVLPVEWYYPVISQTEALKAGAMAIRNYGWYWVNAGGKYATQYGADCDNSTNCQVYIPNYTTVNATDNAVDTVAATGWYQNGSIAQPQYRAGTKGSPSSCGTNCMTQYGSQYWAQQGKAYQWILTHYYNSPTPSYFTIPPARTNPFEVATGSNYVTLSYATPGANQYAVYKWRNNAWNIVFNSSNTIYTDTNATPGQLNYYAVVAADFAGWGPFSFHGGYMGVLAKSPTGTPTPKVIPFFITNKEVRIKTTSTDQNISQYYVTKWNGSAWTTAYNGPTNTYVDTTVSSGSVYNYAVAVYDSATGWSDFVYVAPGTY